MGPLYHFIVLLKYIYTYIYAVPAPKFPGQSHRKGGTTTCWRQCSHDPVLEGQETASAWAGASGWGSTYACRPNTHRYYIHMDTIYGEGYKIWSMQILGSELILNVLSLNSLILQVCLLSWHQLRNWLYPTSNLVPMLLPGQTCNSPARRISALPTNSFPTPIAQIWARSQRMRKGSSPPGILRRREGLAGFFFHGADCGRPACPQAATEPLRPRCHQAWVHGQSTHITQAHGKVYHITGYPYFYI